MYAYAIEYLALSLAIIGILASIIVSWPVLSDLPLKSTIESYARTNIMLILMTYDYDSEKILVTLINVGDTAVIGEIIIAVGLVEREIRKGGIKFDIFGYAPVQWGYTQLENGDIFRLTEPQIRTAVKQTIQGMNKEALHDAKAIDANLLILVTSPTYV